MIVYFDAVKFNGTAPLTTKKIVEPVGGGFFGPIELPPDYVAQHLKAPGAEQFALGGRFDLLLDYNNVATITLTRLVGSEGDEGTDNDSFIGALATIDDQDLIDLYFTKDIYVLRRHRELPAGKSKPAPNPNAVYAGLQAEPVPFDIQKEILSLLDGQMKSKAT